MTYLAKSLTGVLDLQWQNCAAYGESAVDSVVGFPGGKKKCDVDVVGSKQTCDFGGVHGLAAAASYSAAAAVEQHMVGEGVVVSDV